LEIKATLDRRSSLATNIAFGLSDMQVISACERKSLDQQRGRRGSHANDSE
jgi:hypothetical protein